MSTSEEKHIDQDALLLSRTGKIIHQVWFALSDKSDELYDKYASFRESWNRNEPEWYRMEWNEPFSKWLAKTHFPEFFDTYMSYPYDIQRVDMIRYMALSRYGGWYADMDYYCNKPLQDAHRAFPHDFYLVESPNVGGYVSNSLMYSTPNHVFWKRLLIAMEHYKNPPRYYSRHLVIMHTTGPSILTQVFNAYKARDRLNTLPAKLFHPTGITTNITRLIDHPDVYAFHAGHGTWEGVDSKLLVTVYRHKWLFLFILFIMSINYWSSPPPE